MKHKAGQREALRFRQGQWNLAATLPISALGPVWPPCEPSGEPSGDGMVIVQMPDLEMEGSEQWVGADEDRPAGEAVETGDVEDQEYVKSRKRRRVREMLASDTASTESRW